MFARLSSAQEILLDPAFSKGEIFGTRSASLFEKEGKGEIFTIHNGRGGS
jgi:hypothetical protein